VLICGPHIIRRQSPMRLHIALAHFFRDERFEARCPRRIIKSEFHFLSMLNARKRRDRIRHQVALHFRSRLRSRDFTPVMLPGGSPP
jgi:hypothetical protein